MLVGGAEVSVSLRSSASLPLTHCALGARDMSLPLSEPHVQDEALD